MLSELEFQSTPLYLCRRAGRGTEDEATMKRIAYVRIAGMILAGLMTSFVSAQTSTAQEQPLGDYARAVRKDKKPPTAKQFDNDNLPAEDKLSVVGNAGTAGSGQAQTPANGTPDAGQKADDKPPSTQPGESKEDRQKTYDAWKDRLDAQKAKVDLLAREFDVEQREYKLRAAAMYADAGNRMRNSGAWDKEDADYQKKIEEKKKALDDAKKEMDDMQENARKAGVPSSVRE
jgi:type IV secretory pathway VirB10-like protein